MASPARISVHKDASGLVRATAFITAAEIVALGASTTGELSLWTVPAGSQVLKARVRNGGTVFATLATLTASLGINGATTGFMAAETIFAANANAETGVSAAQSIYAESSNRATVVEFTGDANLSTATGGAPGGVIVDMEWIELARM